MDDYSCKKRSSKGGTIIKARNGETYAIRDEYPTFWLNHGNHIDYQFSDDLTFEQAKEILDKCESSFNNLPK